MHMLILFRTLFLIDVQGIALELFKEIDGKFGRFLDVTIRPYHE